MQNGKQTMAQVRGLQFTAKPKKGTPVVAQVERIAIDIIQYTDTSLYLHASNGMQFALDAKDLPAALATVCLQWAQEVSEKL